MIRRIQFACFIIAAFAILFIINELRAQEIQPQALLSPPAEVANPIPVGHCLIAIDVDSANPLLGQLSKNPTIDLFLTRRQGQQVTVNRLMSNAIVRSVAPAGKRERTSLTIQVRKEFAEALMLAKRIGELDFSIVENDRQLEQELELKLGSTERVAMVSVSDSNPLPPLDLTAPPTNMANQTVQQIHAFREQVGRGVRNTLKEIELITAPGEDGGKLLDNAFNQRILELIEQGRSKNSPPGQNEPPAADANSDR